MKKKLAIITIGIALLVLLATVPTNFSDNHKNSGDQEYAYNPPVKLPKLPPKE